ncbi:unnamed protein product, partial [Symbiodinium microadriaticum]
VRRHFGTTLLGRLGQGLPAEKSAKQEAALLRDALAGAEQREADARRTAEEAQHREADARRTAEEAQQREVETLRGGLARPKPLKCDKTYRPRCGHRGGCTTGPGEGLSHP